MTVGGEIAQTFFFSTSGGRTATNEEAFGGAPISYLRSVDDPYDDLSPYHTWTAGSRPARRGASSSSVTLGDAAGAAVASPRRRPTAPRP